MNNSSAKIVGVGYFKLHLPISILSRRQIVSHHLIEKSYLCNPNGKMIPSQIPFRLSRIPSASIAWVKKKAGMAVTFSTTNTTN